MSTVLSAVGGTVYSAGSTAASATIGAAADYALDYIKSVALPTLFYNSAYCTARGASLALGCAGTINAALLSKVDPRLGQVYQQTEAVVAHVAAKADEWTTHYLFDQCYTDFTPSELAGPVLLTALGGWMAAKSLHRFAKDVTLLAKGKRNETVQKTTYSTLGARIKDGKFIPHSGLGLRVSAVRSFILAPIFAGIGYCTEKGIVNRLAGMEANSLPLPAITLTAAAIYTAVQVNAWLKQRNNQDSISVNIENTHQEIVNQSKEGELKPELHQVQDKSKREGRKFKKGQRAGSPANKFIGRQPKNVLNPKNIKTE